MYITRRKFFIGGAAAAGAYGAFGAPVTNGGMGANVGNPVDPVFTSESEQKTEREVIEERQALRERQKERERLIAERRISTAKRKQERKQAMFHRFFLSFPVRRSF